MRDSYEENENYRCAAYDGCVPDPSYRLKQREGTGGNLYCGE